MALITGVAAASFLGLAATSNAAPDIRTIGPGPSSNIEGVKCIQAALKIKPDGQYGAQTYTAVKNFQQQHSPLLVDGAVGRATGDLLLPSAPDGCVAHVPSTYSTQDWVSTPTPGQPTPRAELRAKADALMNMDYLTFVRTKQSPQDPAYNFNFKTDGCSARGLAEYVRPVYRTLFDKPCQQHDFGYRNYGSHAGGLQLQPDENARAWIDGRFVEEMNRLCDRNFSGVVQTYNQIFCKGEASTVYAAVRNRARSSFYD
jgi:peptidoglycan hydrolase-like protein with peptidoglycan-binding domain